MSTDTGAAELRGELGDGLGDGLGDRAAGHAVMAEVLRLQATAPPRSRLARLLGRDPLVPEARSWFTGALGEREVGRRLAALDDRWHVVHSVPVGTRGSDIDHLLVGPGGVVTVNTKHHPGARVWVGATTLLVAGQRQPHLRNARHEAQRARQLLAAAVGTDVPVLSAVAVVGASSLTIKARPDGVAVLRAPQLARWVRRLPHVLDDAAVQAVLAAARDARTWRPATTDPAEPVPPTAPLDGFERLAAQVRTSDLVSRAWTTVGALAASSAVTVALLDLLG